MTKSQIIKLLEPFSDDAQLACDGRIVLLYDIEEVCGARIWGLPYTCVLPVGHEGQCYCNCKKVYFDPEEYGDDDA